MFFPGSSLDYGSPRVPVTLRTELPFWIAVPSQSAVVNADGMSHTVHVHNECVALHASTQVTRAARNLITIRSVDWLAEHLQDTSSPPRFHVRRLRTVVSIENPIHFDCLKALDDDAPKRRNDAGNYLKSVAGRLVTTINKMISTYRDLTHDPFARRVSDWDLPLWYLVLPDGGTTTFAIGRYQLEECLPAIATSGVTSPVYRCMDLTSANADISDLNPGKERLLDAWGDYHRGDHEAAVIDIVTAVEVALDERLTKEWLVSGYGHVQIEGKLQNTTFWEKIRSLEMLSQTRLPGPRVHFDPHVSGTRLREELDAVRRLRNKIVHEGQSVETVSMNRIMETMSWLIQAITEDPTFDPTERPLYAFDASYMTSLTLPTRTTDGKVEVVPFSPPESTTHFIVEVVHARMIHDAILRPDLTYATLASLEAIGFSVADYPFDEFANPEIAERFAIPNGQFAPESVFASPHIAVFLVSKSRLKDGRSFCHRAEFVRSRASSDVRVLFVLDVRLDDPVATSFLAVTKQIEDVLVCSIYDLARQGMYCLLFDFDSPTLRQQIRHGMEYAFVLPRARKRGDVVTVYEKRNVLSVELGSGESLRQSEEIAVVQDSLVHKMEVEELQVNGVAYPSVMGPCRCGVRVHDEITKKLKRAEVFSVPLRAIEHLTGS